MPAIVACGACQTKLKVPENSTAKALRCPKCEGIVPLAAKVAEPPEPKEEDEFEVNEAVDEKEVEFEVNEAADEDEEHEVNEAADEEETDDEDEEEEGEDTLLVELGFPKGKDPFKIAKIPDEAKKAFQKAFVKKEKPLWAGRPSVKIIESKAWIGLVVGPIAALIGVSACLIVSVIPYPSTETRIIAIAIASFVALIFCAVGLLAVIFRRNIGGNVKACYAVTNKRAYIFDGSSIRAFTAHQIADMKCVESSKFENAGDLVFTYDFMGNQGVPMDEERAARLGNGAGNATPVGFLNIEEVQTVRKMLHEVLIEAAIRKANAKRKAKEKQKAKKRFKPFG